MNIRPISLLLLVNLIISCGGGGSESSAEPEIQEVSTSIPTETVKEENTPPPLIAEEIVSNTFSYAAIKSDGTVVTWGHEEQGGDSSNVQSMLTDVNNIYSTDAAFAALKADGTIVTWGRSDYGGDSSSVSSELYDIKEIITTYSSFAALRKDNTVISWGMDSEGYYQTVVTDVSHLVSSRSSFSAIKNDGSIVYWNRSDYEEVSFTAPTITSLIANNSNAFAAVLTSGEVITWGNSKVIENFPSNGMFNVKKVYNTGWGFLATLNDETTQYWGIENGGIFGVDPAANLANIKSVEFSGFKSIALTSTGSVVSWGSYGEKEGKFSTPEVWKTYDDYPKTLPTMETIYGFSSSSLSPSAFGASDRNGNLYLWGGINLPTEPITNVEVVVGAGSAIAVLKQDKTVEYWGNISVEIDPVTSEAKIKPLLIDVASIYATDVGFSAIKEDGTIITWGKFVNDGKVEL